MLCSDRGALLVVGSGEKGKKSGDFFFLTNLQIVCVSAFDRSNKAQWAVPSFYWGWVGREGNFYTLAFFFNSNVNVLICALELPHLGYFGKALTPAYKSVLLESL